MAKIIKIDGENVYIGNSDGTLTTVNKADCSEFSPVVGDIVEVYKSDNQTIVLKSTGNYADEHDVSNKEPVTKVVYCLLALFLGGIGVHKFYARKIGLGLAYLLFCWTCIPALLALVDLIIAICQPADDNGNIYV